MLRNKEETTQTLADLDETLIPNECFCPITREIMKDPVMAKDGHTYERDAIEEWFRRGNKTSPKTNVRLNSTELIPNTALRNLIEDLNVKLPALVKYKKYALSLKAKLKAQENKTTLNPGEKEAQIENIEQSSTNLLGILKAQQPQLQRQEKLSHRIQKEIRGLDKSLRHSKTPSLFHCPTPSAPNKTLLEAASEGLNEIVKWHLVYNNEAIHDQNEAGFTPLLVAAYYGHLETVCLLLAYGASLQDKTHHGTTPLLAAAYNGHIDVAAYLISKGASVTERDNSGKTPLLLAAHNQKQAMALWLLTESGSKISEKDNENKTAINLAKTSDFKEILREFARQQDAIAHMSIFQGGSRHANHAIAQTLKRALSN